MMGHKKMLGQNTTIAKPSLRRALLAALAATVVAANSLALAKPAEAQIQTDPTLLEGKIAFISNRTTGEGVDNPTGDYEIFTMYSDGQGRKQLTSNTIDDYNPTFSPDGKKIAYSSSDGTDKEIYVMKASDGSGKQNLSNNASGVDDSEPTFSPDGKKVAYRSTGAQWLNIDGDADVFVMSATDGSSKKNLSNNSGPWDRMPDFSPSGQKIAYVSWGAQSSNSNGDDDVYVMNAADGSGKQNLTEMPNDQQIDDISPNHSHSSNDTKITYQSSGQWSLNSNSEGDADVFVMSAADGSGKKNLTDNRFADEGDPSVSPYNGKIAYAGLGEWDADIYVMDPNGSKKNITQTFSGAPPNDFEPDWGPGAVSTNPPVTDVQPTSSSNKEQQQEATKPADSSNES